MCTGFSVCPQPTPWADIPEEIQEEWGHYWTDNFDNHWLITGMPQDILISEYNEHVRDSTTRDINPRYHWMAIEYEARGLNE